MKGRDGAKKAVQGETEGRKHPYGSRKNTYPARTTEKFAAKQKPRGKAGFSRPNGPVYGQKVTLPLLRISFRNFYLVSCALLLESGTVRPSSNTISLFLMTDMWEELTMKPLCTRKNPYGSKAHSNSFMEERRT